MRDVPIWASILIEPPVTCRRIPFIAQKKILFRLTRSKKLKQLRTNYEINEKHALLPMPHVWQNR